MLDTPTQGVASVIEYGKFTFGYSISTGGRVFIITSVLKKSWWHCLYLLSKYVSVRKAQRVRRG